MRLCVSAWLRTSLLLCVSLIVHLLGSCVEGRIQLLHSLVDSGDILRLVRLAQILQSRLDRCLLVGRDLVA